MGKKESVVRRVTEDDVMRHPIVRALNPHLNRFVEVRWLSSRLNPHRRVNAIDIGAAVAFMNLPHVKVVAAFGMILDDFRARRLEGKHTIVVPSSGNTVHGVALFAPAFGISRVTAIMPSDAPEAKKSVLAMMPWVRLLHPTGGEKSQDVALEEASRPGCFLLDQYKHPGNVQIHKECTGPQLLRAAGDPLGLVAIGMGSGGTVTGVSQYLKKMMPDIIVLGVRPSSGVRVPGVRDAQQMKEVVTLPYEQAVDWIVEVGREESFAKARELLREVQPQVGPSSGLAYAGLLKYLQSSPDVLTLLRGKKAVFLCPDDGRFYSGPTFSTLDPDQAN